MVKDFLYQCFQKDPNLRITAQKLAKHPWMMASQRQIESSRLSDRAELPEHSKQGDSVRGSDTSPTASRTGKKGTKLVITRRKPSSQSQTPVIRVESSQATSEEASQHSSTAGKAISDLKRRPLTTVYDDAIQRVQEWNEALQGKHIDSLDEGGTSEALISSYAVAVPKSSPKVLRRVARAQPHLSSRMARPIETNAVAESSSGESLAAHLASVGRKPNGIWSRPLGNTVEVDEPNESSDQDASVWDDDFAEAPDLKRFEKGKRDSKSAWWLEDAGSLMRANQKFAQVKAQGMSPTI